MTQSASDSGSLAQEQYGAKGEFFGDRPVLPSPTPVGFGAPGEYFLDESDDENAQLYALAEAMLDDPQALNQLSDRVFEIMRDDLRYQCDRNGGRRR